MNFDYATVRDVSSSIFGTDVDIGKGITDMLVEKLVNGGVFSVIERKALDTILNEQNLSNSDRFDSNSAAKIGRLLGVDAIITGSITQFGRDDKSTNIGGGAVGGITPALWNRRSRQEGIQSGCSHHRAHHQHGHGRDFERRHRKR